MWNFLILVQFLYYVSYIAYKDLGYIATEQMVSYKKSIPLAYELLLSMSIIFGAKLPIATPAIFTHSYLKTIKNLWNQLLTNSILYLQNLI